MKFTYDHQLFIKYSIRREYHYFQGNVILKKKYLIVGIDNNILIIDILSGKPLKRYELFINGEDNSYICSANIIKWKYEDNEFLINKGGNFVLFELTNDNDLKIINQSFFENIKSIKKLNEKNNIFYDDGTEKKDPYNGRKKFSFFFLNDENCFYGKKCVSIFQ